MMSTRTGVRALVMVTLCYGALEIVSLLLLLLLLLLLSTNFRRKLLYTSLPAEAVTIAKLKYMRHSTVDAAL